MSSLDENQYENDIAIIGMAGRFPGAKDVREFWENLKNGVESIVTFTAEELQASGVDPDAISSTDYIKAGAPLDQAEYFDAAFFGFQPKEAELMDPQHRVFLECAWSALEDAGYDSENYEGLIGVYGGVARNTYTLGILTSCPDKLKSVAEYQAMIASEKDYPATRVAYKLNLKGPAVNIQTACSTSGVAIHIACQAIIAGDCDMALAGGGRVQAPTRAGYWYVEGGTMSPDGHCRAFDAEAKGMVRGSGMGFIVLKRLGDAIEDGDCIHAIIKGSAINNDGSDKVGFTAPSVSGQASVIADAQAMADVDADSITYIETHGTGTPLGDPIEIAALTKAFRETTNRNGYCAIGSVKTNIGHLDAGATVAAVIKTVLSFKNKMLPPSLNFDQPNPQIDFANSPFFVNAELREWESDDGPRRAGVSSFGLGGTNVHLILEEAPALEISTPSRSCQLFLLSAKTTKSLEAATQNLASHLKKYPDTNLADTAYTLQTGRKRFNKRRFVVSGNVREVVKLLDHPVGTVAGTLDNDVTECSVAFMFTGQGSQYINMGVGLYETEPVFRSHIDRCAELLAPLMEHDLRTILFPKSQDLDWAEQQLKQTAVTQPALFSIEYSLAQLWRSWGITPISMIGHSIGEYVAACLSGVFILEDALKLVATRGRLMQSLPAGSMLAVSLSEEKLKPYLSDDVSLAVVNARNICVVSGQDEIIGALLQELEQKEITARRLHTSHAFHSHMMEPVLEEFTQVVKEINISPPEIPFVSNVTGNWISDSEATSPDYWARHLRQTVRFLDGLSVIMQQENIALLEVGPGRTLATLALQHPDRKSNQSVVTSIRHPKEETSDAEVLLSGLGRLWLAGCYIDWHAFYAEEKRQHVSLPTYPFEGKRYWINCANVQEQAPVTNAAVEQFSDERSASDVEGSSVATEGSRVCQILLRILSDSSGLSGKDIDPDTSFLQLGFESLSLTQICARIKKELDVEVTLRQILEEVATFRSLSEYIETQCKDLEDVGSRDIDASAETQKTRINKNETNSDDALAVESQRTELIQKEKNLLQELNSIRQQICELPSPAPAAGYGEDKSVSTSMEFPLTEGQLEIWAASQISHENSCAFNLSNWIKMKGDLDVAMMQEAIQDLVSRHEALRINFLADGSGQFVNPEQRIAIPFVDLSQQSDKQRSETLDSIRDEEMESPFDLTAEPLIRAKLIQSGESEFLLFITTHHIICDGWSTGILLRDLAELYSARSEERSPQLQDVMQYSEFTSWNNQIRHSEEGKLSDNYWLKIYQDSVPVLDLPTDRPRPPFKTYNVSRVDMRLEREFSGQIKREAAKQGVTLFVYLLSGFSTLLSRLSNQDDVVVGISAAGQGMAGDWGLVGHCVNFLPLRVTFAEKANTVDHIKFVRQEVLKAFEHQKTSFGSLVKQIDLPRDPGRVPLVSLIFNIAASTHDINLPDLEVEVGSNPRHFENFDLFTNVVDSDNGFELQWTYNTDLFDADTIRLRMEEFKVLLQAMVENPQLPVSRLPLLTPSESKQLFSEWNNTHCDYPADVCLHQLIERQAELQPQRIAVVFENQEISYGELNIKANQLAHQLRSLGAHSDTLVAIAVDRSVEMVVGLLGILKAGAAYLPVDPDFPRDRVSFMLEDANVQILLTQSNLLEYLPEISGKVLCLDTDWPAVSINSENNLEPVSTPEDLAYVIYTSGSTGKPKGVEIAHSAVVNFLFSMSRSPGFRDTDVMLAITTLSFDIAVLELFLPLVVGGKTVIVSRDEALDGSRLLSRLISSNATVMQATPASWRLLLTAGWKSSEQLKVLCGGEAMELELATALSERAESVWNMYGPTETTIWSLCHKVDVSEGVISIGRPIANTQIYVVDHNMQPVPKGVVGELCIGGHGVARGYLQRPELTSERFIDNPFNQQENSKLYRTGDLVRYLPNGCLECLGRMDNQVKVRGFRIELGEIENILMEIDAVSQGVVIAREDTPGDVRLVAYYVSGDNKQATITDLRKQLRSKLPDYMIPQHFVEIDSIPLTPNGKVDRKALPKPYGQTIATPVKELPQSEMGQRIAKIWQEILGIDGVGLHDNFIDLGGHSLLSMQVITKVKKEMDVTISHRAMFMDNLAQIAAHCEQTLPSASAADHGEDKSVSTSMEFPLTEGQLEIWAASQISHENSCAFNLSNWIKMKGDLDVAMMQEAIQDLVSRHEALRINFLADGSGQFVNPEQRIAIPFVDLSQQSDKQRSETLDSIRDEEMESPFDLTAEPLIRAKLIQSGESEFLLFITTHHIICDGWSTGILLRDLAELYSARSEERSPQLQDVMQYSEFTSWNNQIRHSEEGKLSDNYWLKIYQDSVPVLDLPTDRPRPPFKTYNVSRVDMRLEREFSGQIKREAAKQGVTLFVYLLSGFSTLLSRLSNQDDVVVGISAAGQGMAGDWGLVGHCVNFLPLRVTFAEKANTVDHIKFVRQEVLKAFEHQKTSFGSLVKQIDLPRDPGRVPLVSLIFNIAASTHDINLPDLEVEVGSNPRHFENFDLFTNVVDSDNGFELQWTYNTDLFDADTIRLRMEEFKVLLQAMVENPQLPVSRLPLLTPSESKQLFSEWNNTHCDYPADVCLHQLIERQAELQPQRIAVVFENQEISYGELNIKANQLAHQLRSLGAHSDTLVAIAVDRSVEMVVGLLGILKAGAAYLPVDPDFPRDRVSFMLEDANVQILLTQSNLLEYLPEISGKVLCLDTDWPAVSINSENNLEPVSTPEDLAYVIYTSGSTGKPKGVEIAHSAVVNFLFSMSRSPGFRDTDVMLAITTLSFDIAVLELFLPLVVGGKTVIVSRDEALDGSRLLSRLISSNATVMQATPASWRLLLTAGWKSSEQLKVLCGGEAMELELATALSERAESVWNMYGPTETTIWSLCHKVDVSEGVISIGRPIANTQIYVVDHNMQPVPKGVVGELCIGGHGVARGYLQRPELTSERFIDNPFNQQENSKLYRTGDLVRYLPNGCLECLGRMDNQVKVRGFRIELGEIENILMEIDAVSQGVVIAREDTPGDVRLVAYYVSGDNKQATITDLRKQLRSKLPDYMIPQHFVEIDSIPLTPNGKVDRKALPKPYGQTIATPVKELPQSEMGQRIAKIWQEILGIDGVGLHDNFIDLGGHSLLSMQVITKVKKEMDVTISHRAMFMDNLAQIAAHCEQILPSASVATSDKDVSSKENDSVFTKIRKKFRRD